MSSMGVLVFRRQEAPKLKRYGTTKSKVGCLICRVRRVKCDETKPICIQCTKRRDPTKCHWPETPLEKKSHFSKGTGILNSVKPNLYQIQANLFSSPEEYQYFNFFRDNTAVTLSGNSAHGVWEDLILQASDKEEAIRHAVIGLGALDAAEFAAKPAELGFTYSFGYEKPESHRLFALQHYQASLKCLRKAVQGGRQSIECIILGCMLSTLFELYHGNYESVYAQVQTGLGLLSDREHRRRVRSGKERNAFDVGLINIFCRLEFAGMTYMDDPSEMYKRHTMADLGWENIPGAFDSMTEARNWSGYWIGRMTRNIPMPAASDSQSEQSLQRTEDHIPGTLYSLAVPMRVPNSPPATLLPVGYLEPRDLHPGFLRELEDFTRAFEPVYEHSKTPAGRKDYLPALTLHIGNLLYKVILSIIETLRESTISISGAEMLFDNYNAVFAEIVEHSKTVLTHPDTRRPKTCFSLDYQMTVPLHMIGRKCRDPVIRREALALMCSANRREGVWDMYFCGKVAEWMMQIEEMGIEDGVVPEWSRLSGRGLEIKKSYGSRYDLGMRKIWLTCVKPKRDPNEETVILETEIEW